MWAIPVPVKSETISQPIQAVQAVVNEVNNANEPIPTEPVKAVQPQVNVPFSGRHYTKEEVQALIRSYSELYGLRPDTPLCIAQHESGFNQFAKNKSSSASGVFQYLTSTWRGTDESKAGASVFDAEANVKAAIKYMAIHQNTRPWVVAPKCPSLTRL